MTSQKRSLSRIALRAATLAVGGAAVAAMAAPAASASTPDQYLYPQSGKVYIDPVTAQALTAAPVAGSTGAVKGGIHTVSGPSTTVAMLSTAENVIDGPVRQAAGTPGAGVDVTWQVLPNGGVVNTTELRGR
ncbi:MAG TPA: hypothetical protein H9870_01905 [Candidatus Corynebacterium avicola]|uniref:Secreted protein n=1 Tax=Candidatus Corynebacterium avicola TaxID=2838527 RepID=A0A9D1RLQ9_9CORY|nr:hypothetical protein [Candidatus Corynebacterium avicola]